MGSLVLNLSDRNRKKKKPKKGEKAAPSSPGIIRKLTDRFFRYGSKRKVLPGDRLFEIFQSQFLKVSANLGLLGNLHALGIVGDGTPIETSRYIRSKPTCNCSAQGLTKCNPREYSQPDINSGWDSSRDKYFNGYHLYMLSTSDSHYDLPLYPRLQPASRHDSVSLVASAIEFSRRSTLGTIGKILLDFAHDTDSMYKLMDHLQIEPFIDLNGRTKKNFSTESDIRISPEGTPICSMGLKMKSNGFDKSRNRQKWKCSLACGTNNTCEKPCSKAKYGKTFHTFPQDNLRLFTKTPRESEKWKLIYKRRTSVERSNKRGKVDYHLESGRHRSTKMWYIRTYAIMMCQHLMLGIVFNKMS